MRKLTVILALGAILYSCTESEKPDQLNLEEQTAKTSETGIDLKEVMQIPSIVPKGNSENAMMHASFTPIEDVSGDYTTETTLIDISGIPCSANVSSVSNGILTFGFDKILTKAKPGGCNWTTPWGNFPEVEGPQPDLLSTTGQNSVGISFSDPVSTFGIELKPNLFNAPAEYNVKFYKGGNLIGIVTRTLNNPANGTGARLFAASTNVSFDYILIQALNPSSGFAIAQFRYTEKNPFTVDVKPESCENPVNVNSNGVIPVGILASMDLDVNDIDLSTVRLNGVAPQMSSIADLGGFYEKEDACDCDPTDLDGIMDLDLKFDTQEIVATLGTVTDGENVTVELTFDTMDGKSWTGEDCIWVIKKGK